jgi:hypothetical protein
MMIVALVFPLNRCLTLEMMITGFHDNNRDIIISKRRAGQIT